MLVDENVAEELRAKKLHALRRGKIITDDELAVDEEEEEAEAGDEEAEVEADVEADDEEAEGGAAGAAATVRREVKWSLPEGLLVAEKPAKLDDSLVGKIIFMRWGDHGWLVGKISEKFTTATPRLFSKFNYRIKWFDGWENHMLILDNYNSGLSAPYKSWCLLEKEAEEA